MKILFLCHRPYHVLRSAQIVRILRERFPQAATAIFNFNVYSYAGGKIGSESAIYNNYSYIFEYKNYFNEVYEFDRTNEVSIMQLHRFRPYYESQLTIYREILSALGTIDYVVFFSDKEKPIEIVVGLAKEMFNSQAILIDEGIASYLILSNFRNDIIKRLIISLGGFKYLSKSTYFGRSGMYDYSLSNFPQLSLLKGKKYRLPPLHSEILLDLFAQRLRKDIQLNKSKYILYVSGGTSNPTTKKLGRYYLSEEDEIKILNTISKWAKNNNYILMIKEHPLVSRGAYGKVEGATIIEEVMIPPESFFTKNAIVVSTTSSTLINAMASGILAISIIRFCGINRAESLKILDQVGVYCPGSLEEVFSRIKEAENELDRSDPSENDFMTLFERNKVL